VRKQSAKRAAALEVDVEECKAELSAMRGDLREREQEVRSKAGVEGEKDAIAADLKTLQAELAATEAERRDGATRVDRLQQEKAAVERAAQYQLMQGQNESRLKEHLSAPARGG
jgi:hypothetical protein